MGFHNPALPWDELERRLSGRRGIAAAPSPAAAVTSVAVQPGSSQSTPDEVVPYAELHCHSNYSFLDGASSPEDLVAGAAGLGLTGLAITDHDGLYGAVRFAEAAREYNLATIFGAELSLGLANPQNGVADPQGSHILVLARQAEGYRRLSRAISSAYAEPGAQKGRPLYDLDRLAREADENWVILTGCRKGSVRQGLARGVEWARAALIDLMEHFGSRNIVVELTDHQLPHSSRDNDQLAALAAELNLPVVATNAVHYAGAESFELACALAAVRANRKLEDMDGWLPPGPVARLRSGSQMAAKFARYPGAIERSVEIAEQTQFLLRSASPDLPNQEVPDGHTSMSWLRVLVEQGRLQRYGDDPRARARLDHELKVIEAKNFAGYFLLVHDITVFARKQGILHQGRGSAAASAVCYVLGITVVDPVFYDLPFERFLSALRDEEPDIDVDFDSKRREEIIQYVYQRYGRKNAAQVANVITYRPRNAIRDMAKVLGYSQGQQDAWSRAAEQEHGQINNSSGEIPAQVVSLAEQLLGFPRHLGIHSGGMVMAAQSVSEVCPIEPARMQNRTVLQWDKEDCAWMGLVKFDLLGLGMLSAMQNTFELIEQHCGEHWSMDTLPRNEPGVYDMLCHADAIGVFQVESRAQLGTLPRLKPRRFYDLAIEIGLIRPGPVQGGAVHPYLRRRSGAEEVTYPHPMLEPVLSRTLGVPLFQEQLMQMATTVGNCTAADADLLRRAMGSKRGLTRMDSLRAKLYEGMAANGITGENADDIYNRIESFANFGFAESHALSFAVLVYASAWLKLHYPAAFLTGLLRCQPMGFYTGSTLVNDARRRGVKVLPPDITVSNVQADLESVGRSTGDESCLKDHTEDEIGEFDPLAPNDLAKHRRDGGCVIRLGIGDISKISTEAAERILAARQQRPFTSLNDLSRRVDLDHTQLEALALSGCLDSLAGSRRAALWQTGEAATISPGQLEMELGNQPALLPEPEKIELLSYDLLTTGISTNDHPIRHVRKELGQRGALRIVDLVNCEPGRRIEVGGVVTHRQRPSTAGGVTFLNLEDETGMLNVIVSPGVWQKYRQLLGNAPALMIRGILERAAAASFSLTADRISVLSIGTKVSRSRDFR